MADARDLGRICERLKDEITQEVTDKLPRKVGIIAVNHFKQNFRDSGFRNDGLHAWKRTKRQDSNSSDSRYSPLTSSRDHLMHSVQSRTGVGEVTIENNVPYAAIHNEGGTITSHPSITKKMRGFAWHMAYSIAGISGSGKLPKDLPDEAQKWKALALTKKTKANITAHIPQRKFIGNSKELNDKIGKEINETINKIKDGISNL